MLDINTYDYSLPPKKIARYPLSERDNSKLLIYKRGEICEDSFFNLANHLYPDDFLILNNTRVIPARMLFQKKTGAAIEIFCLSPYEPADYNKAFRQTDTCTWECIVGNLKKWKNQKLALEIRFKHTNIILEAERTGRKNSNELITFNWNDETYTFADILSAAGQTPIPPYLNRPAEEIDKERYQTLYSQINGSVAAPTAGFHFSARVFESLSNHGINHDYITLHVSTGTFQPIKEKDADMHEMHLEPFLISLNTLQNIIKHTDHLVAAGTTSLRSLESIYWFGCQIINNRKAIGKIKIDQWVWKKEKPHPKIDALEAVLHYMENKNLFSLWIPTKIMITPGYTFALPKALITNFHLPKSTLLLLIAAFIGEDWRKTYQYAIENNFRFLSYGDSSLLYI